MGAAGYLVHRSSPKLSDRRVRHPCRSWRLAFQRDDPSSTRAFSIPPRPNGRVPARYSHRMLPCSIFLIGKSNYYRRSRIIGRLVGRSDPTSPLTDIHALVVKGHIRGWGASLTTYDLNIGRPRPRGEERAGAPTGVSKAMVPSPNVPHNDF